MGIFLRGFYYGSQNEAEKAVQTFLNIQNVEASFKEVSFLEATHIDASFYPPFETFDFAGRFACEKFSGNQIKEILDLIETRACGSIYASIAFYSLGGVVRSKAPQNTAFFYRNADYIIGIETVWEEPESKAANREWLLERFEYLQSITAGSYINFPYICTDNYMSLLRTKC